MKSEKKIMAYLKAKHSLCIGERTAEDIKLTVDKIAKAKIKVSGRSFETGRKKKISVSLKDLI